MTQWKTELTSGKEKLAEVNIKRGIFQGDSLSPLLFVICLIPLTHILRNEKAGYCMAKGKRKKINHLLFMDDLKLYGSNEKEAERLTNTVRVFTEDIKMEFGIKKCAHITLKRGKVVSIGGMELSSGVIIDEINSKKGYKYLGVLEADNFMHENMKDIIRKEYYKRIRKLTSSKLNGGNVITAINARAVSLVRYSAGIVNWTKEEHRVMDWKTRKMTTNRMYHPQSDVDRLYIPRKEGGRGLLNVMECVENEEDNLGRYVNTSNERLIKCVKDENLLRLPELTAEDTKKRRKEERMSNWKEKALHGKLVRDTEEVRSKESWSWIRKGFLKKETEDMIFAAQEQAIRTNWIKKNIDKQDVSEKCRMCGERDESISHIIAECKKLAQTEYKQRHDSIARILHLEMCQHHKLIGEVKWYNHKPESVMENENVKILWDFNIQTDHIIEHRRPDIVILHKRERRCDMIDVAVPGDKRVASKEQEKIDNYRELQREIKKIWNLREVRVIPVVVGALGMTSKDLKNWLEKINIKSSIELLQKATLLGTAKILRKVLET